MSDLRLHLGDTDFADLAQLGRSLLPRYAPDWTDHNIHDPGIMLKELLAWIFDAQVYSLSRLRRDERQAYARLLGLHIEGPQPAEGLLWPIALAPPPWINGTTVKEGAAVMSDREEIPAFRTASAVSLTTARLESIWTRADDGSAPRDWTTANDQDGASFQPFGDGASWEDRLILHFQGALVGPDGAVISIGFQVASVEGTTDQKESVHTAAPRVTVDDSRGERPARVVQDTTQGLSRSGTLLLRVEGGAVDGQSTITIRGPVGGFLRPPALERIAPNVLPVRQLRDETAEEASFGTGLPDQEYRLQGDGLVYPDRGRFEVHLTGGEGFEAWTKVDELKECSPDDKVFSLDCLQQVVQFGNGVNGQAPPPATALRVLHELSAGARGNVGAGHRWTVAGIGGDAWVNREPTTGGRDGLDLAALRSGARRKLREVRPIVTTDDLESAARSFGDLGVARAQELVSPVVRRRVRGTRTLVALGPGEAVPTGENWRRELESRLAGRLPLGQRLELMGPRYVDFGVKATLVATPRADPDDVGKWVIEELEAWLRTVPRRKGDPVWPLGRDVTLLAVKGWLRRARGVAAVRDASLCPGRGGAAGETVRLGATGLPRLRAEATEITVLRGEEGGAQ